MEKLRTIGGYADLFASGLQPELSLYVIQSAKHAQEERIKSRSDLEQDMVALLSDSVRLLDAQLEENTRLIGRVNEILLGVSFFLARRERLRAIRASLLRGYGGSAAAPDFPFAAIISRAMAQGAAIDDIIARARLLFGSIGESIDSAVSHISRVELEQRVAFAPMTHPNNGTTEKHFLERLIFVARITRAYSEGLKVLITWAKKERDILEFIYARCAILLADGAD